MELEDGILFIIIGTAISISLIYLTQNIITTNQTILHELGHRIAFDYNDSTEETAKQYANQNSWRCETI